MRTALALGLLMIVVGVAGATPSTLVWIPSTDIQADGTWHLGIDNYFTPTAGSKSPTDVGLTYGLLSGKLEVGLDYFGGQDDPFYVNAKYLVRPESGKLPAIALGGYNFGTAKDVTDANVLYGLAAKTFGPVRLTAGYAHGKSVTLGVDPDMLLLGADGYLTGDKKWWGAVDFQSGDSALGALSFGLSYSFADNVSVLVGCDLYNNAALDDTVTTQLDISF